MSLTRSLARSGIGATLILAFVAACGGQPAAPPPPLPASPGPVTPAPSVALPTPTSSVPPPAAAPPAPPAPPTKTLRIWLSGYSWQDNTPPGSSIVGEPVLHHEAGGQGTFADPITVAVPGHQGAMAWAPGTKFYLPTVRRYVIVEDSGAAPPPAGTATHLDMWIGGQGGTLTATNNCEDAMTGRVPAQLDPPDGLPVIPGPIYSGGRCHIP